MNPIERARLLAEDIRQSEEYKIFAQYKEEADSDPGIKSLLQEYARMQTRIQLSAAAGQQPDADLVQRFSSMNALLYNDPRTSGYLLSQLRLQKMTVDVLQIIGEASGLDMGLPL